MSRDEVQDRRPGRFWMDDAVIDRFGAELGPYGLSVYMILSRRADKNHDSHPSVGKLAAQLGMSRRQAQDTLKKLVALKLVKVERRTDEKGRQTSNLYTLLPLPVRGAGDAQAAPQTPGGEGREVHPKEDTEKKEDTEEVVTNVPTSSGDGQKEAAPTKPISAKSFGISRLADFVKEAKAQGKQPVPLDEFYKRRFGDIYAAHLSDGWEVDELDPALRYLVLTACGEAKESWLKGKKRWIPLVDAIEYAKRIASEAVVTRKPSRRIHMQTNAEVGI